MVSPFPILLFIVFPVILLLPELLSIFIPSLPLPNELPEEFVPTKLLDIVFSSDALITKP